jgi:hypothetical protein
MVAVPERGSVFFPVLSALAPTDGMAAILLPLLPLERNKAVNCAPLHAGRIADLRPLGAKSDRTDLCEARALSA